MKLRLDDIHKLIQLSNSRKHLIIEAAFVLFIARIVISIIPFRFLASALWTMEQKEKEIHKSINTKILNNVKWAIDTVSRFIPWKNTCLTQGVAGKMMLKQKKQPSVLILGVAYDEKGKLIAHAWLRAGDMIITGAKNRNGYTIISAFTERNS